MSRYKYILWDLDETLLDFKKAEEYALRQSFLQFEVEIDKSLVEWYSNMNRLLWKQLETGEIQGDQVFTGRFVTLFDKMGRTDIDPKHFREIYQTSIASVAYPYENAIQTLQLLQPYCQQYIVTNGKSFIQREKIERAGFDQIMDTYFIADEMNIMKPHEQFFEHCFQTIGDWDKSHYLIVGDSLTSDMEGGRRAGIDTCWYNPDGKTNELGIPIRFEIKDLLQVIAIVTTQEGDTK